MSVKIKGPSEAQIQADFFRWVFLHEKRFPELQLFYSVPNGANKSPAARGLFKRTGLKAGVPDCHLPAARQNFARTQKHIGLWIEFKSGSGVIGATQKEWIEKLRAHGHAVAVCRSWTEAANITIEYLNLPIKKF